MNAAEEAYTRLMAAQRVVSPHELAERKAEQERESQALRIKRKLKEVY